jgi:NAD(P)-dependent dehydrogenase (short-subunit alcohol dehydrogenase family)
MPGEARQAMYRQAAERLPVGRIGTPADLGEAALFLMTNGYTTGSCWTWTAGRGWGARASLAADDHALVT